MKRLWIAILLCSVGRQVPATDGPYSPPRIERSPVIDGRLDESEWSRALAVDDFVQRLPREGDQPTEKSVVLLMHTATDFFIGVRFYDSHPTAVTATVMRRDNFDVTRDDQFAVAIDSYGDGRNGYWFSTNPLGARVDAQFFEEGEIWQGEWNGIWDCASRIDRDGWTSEIRIPFSTLRFNSAPRNTMGINLFRRLVRTNEQLFSPLVPLRLASGTPNVSVARRYVFEGITAGHDARVRPFLLGERHWRSHARERNDDPAGGKPKVGFDAAYGLTPSLTANLTVNTDFALTELDDRQINLSRFDLFYPEKRDFFLENGGLFQFGLPQEAELFFSRRIGLLERSPGRTTEVPLRFGAKVTGRAGPLELGLLEVRTSGGQSEGTENSLVGRVKYGFGRSYAGVVATHKRAGDQLENAAVGADATVYVTGDVALTSFVAWTRRSGATSWPTAWNVTLAKRGEEKAFRAAVTDIDGRFDPDLGFVSRSGIRKLDGAVQIPWYVHGGTLRRLVSAYSYVRIQPHASGADSWVHTASVTLDLQSEDSLRLYGGRSLDVVEEPFQIFRETPVPAGEYGERVVGLTLISKPGRRFSGQATVEARDFYGGHRRTFSSQLRWRASRFFGGGLDHSSSWVHLPTGAFRAQVIQGRLDVSWDTRLSGRAILQHDNASEDLGLNLRVNYLLREGTELALVYGRDEDRSVAGSSGRKSRPADHAALFKVSWLFHF